MKSKEIEDDQNVVIISSLFSKIILLIRYKNQHVTRKDNFLQNSQKLGRGKSKQTLRIIKIERKRILENLLSINKKRYSGKMECHHELMILEVIPAQTDSKRARPTKVISLAEPSTSR